MKLDEAAPQGLAEKARAGAVLVARTPALRWRATGVLVAGLVLVSALKTLFAPFFVDPWRSARFGFLDWDAASAWRYLTVLALGRYHQLPLWNPWLCGGAPAWAYSEGATNLVSPFFPFYAVLPLPLAERVEVICATAAAFGFTYLLAGRVTKSTALRALVAAAYALNGRWVMQLAEGHAWHLALAWLPLALYVYDVSLDASRPDRARWATWTGAVLAMVVYTGGVAPLAQTVLLLGVYGCIRAVTEWSATPLKSLAIAGAAGVGLSAPKLFPVIELLRRAPPKVDAGDVVGMGPLISVFTDAFGTVDRAPPVSVLGRSWAEYGIYVGLWLTAALIASVLLMTTKGRSGSLRASGVFFLILGCGAFHKYAPWTVLHQASFFAPLFAALQTPARCLLPALLLLMLTFAGIAGGAVDRVIARRPWLDLVLLVPVYFVAMNLAATGLQSTVDTFTLRAPAVARSAEFRQAAQVSFKYAPEPHEPGKQDLLAMYANTGVLRCSGAPEIAAGAIAQDDAAYHGEAYVAGAKAATARVTEWSPNAVTIHYDGAEAGSSLVYNMNFDPGWRANGSPAVSYKSAVSTPLAETSGDVTFRYYPRGMTWGLVVFAITAFLLAGGARRVAERLNARAAAA